MARSLSPAPSLLFALVVCAAGCGAGSPEGETIHFDACQDLIVVPDADATDAQLVGIRSGIALWNQRAGTRLSLEPAATAAQVAIHFARAAEPFHGFYDAAAPAVFINDDLKDAPQSIVIAHEIGHAFSLPHINDRRSVMTAGNLDTEPTAEDVDTLASVWGACPSSGVASE